MPDASFRPNAARFHTQPANQSASAQWVSRQRTILDRDYPTSGDTSSQPQPGAIREQGGIGAAPLKALDRGRLVTTKTIRREIFSGQVSEWWIRRNVAPAGKIRLAHSTVMWHEQDVHDWIAECAEPTVVGATGKGER